MINMFFGQTLRFCTKFLLPRIGLLSCGNLKHLWRFNSHNLTIFVAASDYKTACDHLKNELVRYIEKANEEVILDEIIEIVRLKNSGIAEEITSSIEFTDYWLKERGMKYKNISI